MQPSFDRLQKEPTIERQPRNDNRLCRKQYPHIAPEIVSGRKGQSIQSDIFSFAKMAQGIFDKTKLGTLPEMLNRGLNIDPDSKPQLQQILEALG